VEIEAVTWCETNTHTFYYHPKIKACITEGLKAHDFVEKKVIIMSWH